MTFFCISFSSKRPLHHMMLEQIKICLRFKVFGISGLTFCETATLARPCILFFWTDTKGQTSIDKKLLPLPWNDSYLFQGLGRQWGGCEKWLLLGFSSYSVFCVSGICLLPSLWAPVCYPPKCLCIFCFSCLFPFPMTRFGDAAFPINMQTDFRVLVCTRRSKL